MNMLVAAARKSVRAMHDSSSSKLAESSNRTAMIVWILGLVLSAVSNTLVEGPLKEFSFKFIFVRQADVAMI